MAIQYHLGIDFGTTNSSAVQLITHDGDTERRLCGDDEGRPLPSIVAIDKTTGEVFVGREAWSKRAELAQSCECIQSVKSLLEDEGWSKFIGGRQWNACDVAAEVFKALRRSISPDIDSIWKVTIAIPIGFSRRKRELIRYAAQYANLEVEGFVSEPTAAFFANYEALKADDVVVVFDWGGGTLDVSVLKHSGGRISELATSGMPIAGDEIDDRLARKVHAKVARAKGVSVAFEDMPAAARDLLLVKAERAKRALSEDEDAVVTLNRYGDIGAFRERITYEWFEAIVDGIVDDAIGCLDRAIAESGEGFESIDRIVMVGGSSNIGPLLDRLEARFGEKLFFPDETVWSISNGAALLSMSPGSYHSAQKVGVILADGSYFPLLEEDERISGWERDFDFALTDISQEVRVVFSGSNDIDRDEDKRRVVSVPNYRFLEEKIHFEARVDENAVFQVKMKSTMKAKSERIWEYDRLKLYYMLSECGF